jgi:hypothetical protein
MASQIKRKSNPLDTREGRQIKERGTMDGQAYFVISGPKHPTVLLKFTSILAFHEY